MRALRMICKRSRDGLALLLLLQVTSMLVLDLVADVSSLRRFYEVATQEPGFTWIAATLGYGA